MLPDSSKGTPPPLFSDTTFLKPLHTDISLYGLLLQSNNAAPLAEGSLKELQGDWSPLLYND